MASVPYTIVNGASPVDDWGVTLPVHLLGDVPQI
ncbi:hypothetical protein A2U01_0079386 [Trifolium medium]|uniref:Uncharacterized protein n=1 Tax=Trifolium medium TaxID=97028 RepID=A0A392TAF8_9FABA|nr:hypothetical protein [Trifolium medium]